MLKSTQCYLRTGWLWAKGKTSFPYALNGNNYHIAHQILRMLNKVTYIKCSAHDLIHNRYLANENIYAIKQFSFSDIAIAVHKIFANDFPLIFLYQP